MDPKPKSPRPDDAKKPLVPEDASPTGAQPRPSRPDGRDQPDRQGDDAALETYEEPVDRNRDHSPDAS